MDTITQLQNKIAQVQSFIVRDREALQRDPNDVAAKFSLPSWERHFSELKQELLIAQRERHKEIVDLRLMGALVDNGSVPLNILAELSRHLYDLFSRSAHRIQYGKDALRGVGSDIPDKLGLSLTGLSYGSSRLAISANVAPDLAGDSPMQASLNEVFEALVSDNADLTHVHLHKIGSKATFSLSQLLRSFQRHSIVAEIEWDSPSGRKYSWTGTLNRIEKKLDQLGAVNLSSTQVERIKCEVEMLSNRGRVDLREVETNEKMKCSYPSSARELVESLTIGEIRHFIVQVETFTNHATGKTSNEYMLLGDKLLEDKT